MLMKNRIYLFAVAMVFLTVACSGTNQKKQQQDAATSSGIWSKPLAVSL